MKKLNASLLAGFCVINSAEAEEVVDTDAADTAVVLESISIVDRAEETTANDLESAGTYESFAPLDSGLSVISKDSISAAHQGGLDTSELLKSLPFVQLDSNRYEGSARAEQHLNPSDFTISGARFYDNNIMVDGVSVNSVMDVTQSQDTQHNDEVNGQTAQTFYVAPSLLEAVEVFDSNVSAQYGSFRGGVVNFQIREPSDKYGAQISTGLQTDEMVHYLGDDADGDPYPDFIKYETSIAVDTPLTEKLKVLTGYSRSGSRSNYQMNETYGGKQFTNEDISENFLLKGVYDINESINVESAFQYSPYSSEHTDENNADSERISNSTGLIAYFKLNGTASDTDWSSKLSYNLSNASREWDRDRFRWSSQSEYGSSLCDSSYCYEGGYGDINQTQEDYLLDMNLSHALGFGTLSAGSQSTYTRAVKERPEPSTYYRSYVLADGFEINCASDDKACRSDTAFTSKVYYDSYKADVGVFSQALWSELEADISMFTLRGGLRYEYDDYLENHLIAPRFSGTWEFASDRFATLGLNRYYKGGMLAYAIKEATPPTIISVRKLNDDGTLTDWAYSDTGSEYRYSAFDLKTPYSDEVSMALTLPTALDGSFRIKGIKRLHRDGFSSTWQFDSDNNQNLELSNNGKADYLGLALEWKGQYRDHSFGATLNWSQTKTYGFSETYMGDLDVEEQKNNLVYYNNEIISEYDLSKLETLSNYATPISAELSWSKSWLNKRLLTMTKMNYRGGYTFIEDSSKTVNIEGISYDLYEETKMESFVDFSFNSQLELMKTAHTQTIFDMRISNLLNSDPNSKSSTYRRGRAFWVGATVKFF